MSYDNIYTSSTCVIICSLDLLIRMLQRGLLLLAIEQLKLLEANSC